MKTWELQQSIFAALNAHAPLTALVGTEIHDHNPQAPNYPYVMIGDSEAEDFDTDDSIGSESRIVFHVWSRYRGGKETKQIQRAIYDALHRATLAVVGADFVNSEIEFEDVFLEPDGLTRHGTQRLRVMLDNV